jgi:hypothetical protein
LSKFFFVLICAALAPRARTQTIDLSALDKLANRASEVNTISLDGDNLRTAAQFLSGNNPDVKQARSIVEGLQGIWVRNFAFKDKEEYSTKDLVPVRDQLKTGGWSKVVESREKDETSEIYLRSENQKTIGLAIISQEPKELTVVVISGSIDLERLGKLSGSLGIPPLEPHHPQPTLKPSK